MPSLATVPTQAYSTSIAHDAAQVRAAQRLRTAVFGDELGAALPGALDSTQFDTDEFDAVCDHLIVTHEPTGEVVGTYRLLPPGRTRSLYSAGEFDVSALAPLRGSLIEAGRSCVHPDHRGGSVINLMWSALARYMLLSGHRYLAGCASVPLADGGRAAISTWRLAESRHAAPANYRVQPHQPWSGPSHAERPSYAHVPPLLRGYLRLGAWVCGPPAHDEAFGVADFFVLLRLDHLDERYLRYFLGDAR
ncbi:GNAT family N-acyltransferase [Saccharomonospora sp. NPDC046836]|uniref:GNAT family N-acetyltransferase n=1 Tax=Saccharomonospora sp. NPDC046836 TaxID=3156921 RepID=UPI0033E4B668